MVVSAALVNFFLTPQTDALSRKCCFGLVFTPKICRPGRRARYLPRLCGGANAVRGQDCPHHRVSRVQAENEVPQPHDFDAWGFTNTKPCCISVS